MTDLILTTLVCGAGAYACWRLYQWLLENPR